MAKKTAATKAAPKKTAAKKTTVAKKTAAPAKAAAPNAAKKAANSSAGARQPNPGFMKEMTPSAALAAVIGSSAIPRTQVVKKLWDYIKKHKLQDATNRRNINADEKLKAVFGKDTVSMFEMTKIVSKHLK